MESHTRRVSELVAGAGASDELEGRHLAQRLHATIDEVTDLVFKRRSLNVAIARLMELSNVLGKSQSADAALQREALEALLIMLAPFAPHTAEQLWHELGTADGEPMSVHSQPWPLADKALASDLGSLHIVVQVGGKKRATIELPLVSSDAQGIVLPSEQDIAAAAREHQDVQRALGGRPVRREIVVLPKPDSARPHCLVNLVPGKL